jgi:hypothetical protein
LPKTEAVALSPDGLKIASVGNVNDNRLLIVQTTDGKMLKASKIGLLKLSGLEWAGNDFVILYLHQTARLNVFSPDQEFTEGVVINLMDGTLKPLVRSSPEYLPAILGNYGFVLQNGHWFAYLGLVPTEPAKGGGATGGYFKQRYPDLYRVDLETGASKGSPVERPALEAGWWIRAVKSSPSRNTTRITVIGKSFFADRPSIPWLREDRRFHSRSKVCRARRERSWFGKGCNLQRVAALNARTENGRLLIQVKLNGRDSRLQVDTGSPYSVITNRVADELKLPLEPIRDQSRFCQRIFPGQ